MPRSNPKRIVIIKEYALEYLKQNTINNIMKLLYFTPWASGPFVYFFTSSSSLAYLKLEGYEKKIEILFKS